MFNMYCEKFIYDGLQIISNLNRPILKQTFFVAVAVTLLIHDVDFPRTRVCTEHLKQMISFTPKIRVAL
jgi:hypothetical protein